MRQIFRPDLPHGCSRIEVVAAVGHAESALQKKWHVSVRMVEILCDPQPEQIVRIDIGGIQNIDIGAKRAAEKARELDAIRYRADRFQRWLQRSKTLRLNARFIHKARVVVAYQADRGSCGLRAFVGVLDQIGEPALDELLDHIPGTVGT